MAHAARPPQPKDAYDGKAPRGTLTCVIRGIDILIVAEPIAEGGGSPNAKRLLARSCLVCRVAMTGLGIALISLSLAHRVGGGS